MNLQFNREVTISITKTIVLFEASYLILILLKYVNEYIVSYFDDSCNKIMRQPTIVIHQSTVFKMPETILMAFLNIGKSL